MLRTCGTPEPWADYRYSAHESSFCSFAIFAFNSWAIDFGKMLRKYRSKSMPVSYKFETENIGHILPP